jgi:hypothetical protein
LKVFPLKFEGDDEKLHTELKVDAARDGVSMHDYIIGVLQRRHDDKPADDEKVGGSE